MKSFDLKPGLISLVTAFGASLCCVLPLTVVFFGLGSGAFMMTTMQYRPVLYPLGLLGLTISIYLYFRKSKDCKKQSCSVPNKKLNLFLLIFSGLLMGTVTYLDFFVTSI
jgi:hypothetical protein